MVARAPAFRLLELRLSFSGAYKIEFPDDAYTHALIMLIEREKMKKIENLT